MIIIDACNVLYMYYKCIPYEAECTTIQIQDWGEVNNEIKERLRAIIKFANIFQLGYIMYCGHNYIIVVSNSVSSYS